ncbi:MAG: AraC family transcriptional regulator [Verrucomicrobiaceae bacterium]|nr:MAG: AraC family transcriptional regulator [Verrucomicrobiaceae bacterium]
MRWPTYHQDWKPVFQGGFGWRLHWFGRFGGHPGWSVPESRLAPDMVSFFFVEKNPCWACVNGRKFPLKPGDLLVVSGADEFSIGHDPARPNVHLSVSLALSQPGVANALLQRSYPRRFAMPDPARYVEEFERVLTAMSDDTAFRDLAIAGALAQWLAYLLNTLQPPLRDTTLERSGVVDRLLAAQAWANVRLAGVITLAEWAAAVNLNPVYFGRIFKRETGLKPMEWLGQRRLEMAAQYLSSTSKTVTEIAGECGYACPFYFSRQFRRHHGLSPLLYRRTSFERKAEESAPKHLHRSRLGKGRKSPS